jgi:clorobiocin biosynthesis protein CloN3
MNFDLLPEQRKRYDETLDGVRAELARPGEPATRAEWRVAGRLGLTGLCLPREHGGSGLGALDTALCLEAFGRGCATAGLPFAVAAHLLACGVAIRDFASDETAMLAGMASGELIAANAMTEDDAGSDVGRLATTARRDGDGYVLDGEKSFASNAPLAGVFVTYAVTDPTAGFLGVTAFAVPRDLPGVEVGPPLEKMGLHGCAAARVRLSGCRIPERLVLGRTGQGGAVFQHTMEWERACLPAVYLGAMDDQLERVIAHARERRQFGREIAGFQAVSHRIAVMAQRLESARLLLYRACWLLDQGRGPRQAVAMSKAAVSEAAVANGLDAVQIFGAAGYLTGPGIEARLRDAVPSTIFSGTTEIQREIIAREAGL